MANKLRIGLERLKQETGVNFGIYSEPRILSTPAGYVYVLR